jgi:hypothetical protein
MLVSLGYKQEDILEKASDPLEWSKEMDVEIYKKTARTELEKEEHKIFLDSIGMKFL